MDDSVLKRIKRLSMWQRCIIVVIMLIIFARIGYIFVRGEVDRKYVNYDGYDFADASMIECKDILQEFNCGDTRLNSVELIFDNIADNKLGTIVLCMYVDDELLYQAKLSLANINNREWKKVYINAKVYAEKKYRLTLSASDDCTQIPKVLIVNDNYAPEIISSKNGENIIDGQVIVNYGYLVYPTLSDRLVMISLWIIFGVCAVAVTCNVTIIRQKYFFLIDQLFSNVDKQLFVTVMEIILCTIIIGSSKIEFQNPTKIVLYIISLVATIKIERKVLYIKALTDKSWKVFLIFLAYAYSAFALVGQRIWIYPLNSKLTTAGLTVYVIALIWFIPIVDSFLYYANVIRRKVFSDVGRISTWKFVVWIDIILIVPAAYNLFANNPGISSPDTYNSMIANAWNLHGMYDWHPFFYCLVLRIILEVWNSTYMVILVQYFFYAYVVTEILLYFRKKGIRNSILIGTAVFTGLNAGNYIQINTIWKDIPYTLSLLWIFIIISKLVIDNEFYKTKWYIYLELIVAIVGIDLYRKNGIVTFVVVIACMILVMKKNVKVIVSILLSVGIIAVVKGPLYNHFEVESPGRRGMYIGLGMDILGAYYSGGEVSEDTLKMITNMTDYNNAEYSYISTWSYQSYDVDVEPVDFIKHYIGTFIRNPIVMLRAIIDREDALWDIYKGEGATIGCVNYTGTEDDDMRYNWNDFYPKREYVSLYTEANAASSYTASSQWISAIEWRCGVFTLLGVLVLINLLLCGSYKQIVVIISPMIGHILSLLLSTGWADFRYFWPMNLLNMVFLLLMFVLLASGDSKKDGEIVEA